jgi:hypothetical protein
MRPVVMFGPAVANPPVKQEEVADFELDVLAGVRPCPAFGPGWPTVRSAGIPVTCS